MIRRSGQYRRLGFLGTMLVAIILAVACAPAAPPTPTPAPPKPAAPAPAAPAAAPTAAPKPAAPAPTAVPAKPAAPAPAPTAAPKPKAVVKWRIIDQRAEIKQAFTSLGIEKGFFREEGLDVEQIRADSASSSKALLAGQADRADFEVEVGLLAVDQGAPIVLVSSKARPTDFMFARPDIQKVEDLVGKKVAINTVGSQPHQLFLSVFKKRGIDPTKVEYVQVGGDSARMAAVLSGQVSAGSGDLSNTAKMTQAGMKPLLFFADELPEERSGWYWVTADNIKNRSDLVEADLTAVVRSIRYAYENEKDTVAFAQKLVKEDDANKVRDTYQEFKKFKLIDPNLTFNEQIVNGVMDKLIAQGKLKARIPLAKFANFQIRNKVIAKLGEYKW